MIPLDFSMITDLKFGGCLLRRFESIGDHLELVIEAWVPIPMIHWRLLNGLWTPSRGVMSTQMTRAFIMYILGYSTIFSRGDKIHLSYQGSLESIGEIH